MVHIPKLNTLQTENKIPFKVEAPFEPTGDQPQAIEALAQGIQNGQTSQVLLGATGTGKTFTIAKLIEKVQKPTLVIAHNKTLAAQLASEFKEFFPHNAVEYFVSYYDYYQPEAYIAQTDTYIEKILPSMMKLISFAILQLVLYLNVVMLSLLLAYLVSMV